MKRKSYSYLRGKIIKRFVKWQDLETGRWEYCCLGTGGQFLFSMPNDMSLFDEHGMLFDPDSFKEVKKCPLPH